MKKLFASALGLFLIIQVTASVQALEKSPYDESVSRHLVLENGLKVLLVSDPGFNVSAAALEVQAGSLMDPEERQGLAHFLEHMLFLGTEKYPDPEEFPQYLERNGGYSNAYTADDRTNYHMEVQHDAFEGALDRFSRFFIDPLFSTEYIEREINAVDSEHQKNLEQDAWRQFQLLRAFYRKDHPASHFSTGDGETLKGVTGEEFLRFYNTYYSANRMSLVLLSNKGLDELETLARKYFLPIKDTHAERLTYDPDYLEPVEGLRIINCVPVQDIRELTLTFSIPSYIDHYDVKPESLISFCIGHEGKGSLLSYLKEQGLATALSAGAGYSTPDYGSFTINIQLTQKGLERYRDVIGYCFSYIRLLRDKGIDTHVFEEVRRMAELDFTYGDKGEGAQRASALADNLNRYPIDAAESVDYIYERLDQGLVMSVLDNLRPDNMLCMVTAPGLETDSVEPWYGTEYSYRIEKGAFYSSLLNPAEVAGLSLPGANPFLPDNVTILAERPVNLIREPGIELWYAQDTTFKRPKVSLIYHIRPPEGSVDAAYMARLYLYADCINERLNETAYSALMAGLDYGFSADLDGLTIIISGYAASGRRLLDEIRDGLRSLDISEQQFEDIKDNRLREWKNFKLGEAWDVARETSRRIRKETYFGTEALLEEASTLTLSDIREFTGTLYDRTRLEGLVTGDITADEAISLTRLLSDSMASEPLDNKDAFEQRILVEEENDPITYMERLETNNSCLWRTIHLGDDTPEVRMAAGVLEKFISPLFYAEMRTRQQLGYIVWTVAPEDNGQRYLFFVVQSESHPADRIRLRAEEFMKGLPEEFAAMSEEEFAEYKEAVRQELLEKPKTIAEKSAQFYDLTFDKDGDFDRLEEGLEALEGLTRARVAEMLKEIVDPRTRRVTDILLFAKQHDMMEDTKATMGSIDSFKEAREFVARPERGE